MWEPVIKTPAAARCYAIAGACLCVSFLTWFSFSWSTVQDLVYEEWFHYRIEQIPASPHARANMAKMMPIVLKMKPIFWFLSKTAGATSALLQKNEKLIKVEISPFRWISYSLYSSVALYVRPISIVKHQTGMLSLFTTLILITWPTLCRRLHITVK